MLIYLTKLTFKIKSNCNSLVIKLSLITFFTLILFFLLLLFFIFIILILALYKIQVLDNVLSCYSMTGLQEKTTYKSAPFQIW